MNPFEAPDVPRTTARPALPTASVLQRGAGWFIDFLVSWSPVWLAGILYRPIGNLVWLYFLENQEQIHALIVVSMVAISPLVLLVQWAWVAKSGRTLGKWVVGTRIVREDGSAPGFVHGVVLRYLLFFALHALASITVLSWPLFLLDTLYMATNDRRQTLHDRIAGTLVIRSGKNHRIQSSRADPSSSPGGQSATLRPWVWSGHAKPI